MNVVTWLTPMLSLIGALLGGIGSVFLTEFFRKRNVEVKLVREARIALERWYATRNGPSVKGYTGRSDELMQSVGYEEIRKYFANYISATLEAKAALGAVRHLDARIAKVLDVDDWKIPESDINELREALVSVEIDISKVFRHRHS